uniref:CARD domain-containing protein n=1 Tax=Ignisphaera aggregans TaxID=334771 RepID=A0A7C4FI90_9CREN
MVKRKRDRLSILFDILKALSEEPQNPTKLAVLVNMPYDRLKKILDELVEKGLLQYEEQGRVRIYSLSKDGCKVYEELRRVRKVLQDYGLLD